MRLIVAAVSLDGFISPDADACSLDWTCAEDKKIWMQLSREREWPLVIVGGKTWRTLLPRYQDRIASTVLIVSHVPIRHNDVDLNTCTPTVAVERLGREKHALIIGGGFVYQTVIDAGCYDELAVVLQPSILGSGVRFHSGSPAKLELVSTVVMGQAVCCRYSRKDQA